jgi:hypothetical protein
MGASLTMIDRHYGHLARDGREHAIKLLDNFTGADNASVHAVDAAWTPQRPPGRPQRRREQHPNRRKQEAL